MKNFLISVFIFSLSHLAFAYSTLHSAAETGDLDRIHEILESGVSVNLLDEQDLTPLHTAARRGQAEAVRLLLEEGAYMDMADDFGWTPLHWAVANGHLETAELLTSNNYPWNLYVNTVEFRDKKGWTPLHVAVRHQHKELVELLLDRGANIDAMDKRYQTPLITALMINNLPVVVNARLIGSHSGFSFESVAEQVAGDPDLAEHFANQKEKSLELAELLLDRGADPNAGGSSFEQAFEISNQFLFGPRPTQTSHERLVHTLVDPAFFSPLHYAALNGDAELVSLLLDKGANPDFKISRWISAPRTALDMAVKEGHDDVIAVFESRGLTK